MQGLTLFQVVYLTAAAFCIAGIGVYRYSHHSIVGLLAIGLSLSIFFGIIPAHLLRHAVQTHKPHRWHHGFSYSHHFIARMIFWMVSMLFQIMAGCCYCITSATTDSVSVRCGWRCHSWDLLLAFFITSIVAITITITAVVIGVS